MRLLEITEQIPVALPIRMLALEFRHLRLEADGGIPELYVAGSAWLPRFMAEATQHGASIGLAI